MSGLRWVDDPHLPGFQSLTLETGTAWDGPTVATLVRPRENPPSDRAVLYVHGFMDYFFHSHVAAALVEDGWAFYAVDLRRHGRSLRPYQRPNTVRDIDELLADLDAAVDVVEAGGHGHIAVFGHSTGGLVAALHAHRGRTRANVRALVLNSPFLSFAFPSRRPPHLRLAMPAACAAGAAVPWLPVNRPFSIYGRSIHASERGEWQYDLRWKPLEGVTVHAGWLRALRHAHAEVRRGLDIEVPILVLRSARSTDGRRWGPGSTASDTVLDVHEMARLSATLGRDVRIVALDGALHDVTLSAGPVRTRAMATVRSWLAAQRPPDWASSSDDRVPSEGTATPSAAPRKSISESSPPNSLGT